jgi:hypothetical protein
MAAELFNFAMRISWALEMASRLPPIFSFCFAANLALDRLPVEITFLFAFAPRLSDPHTTGDMAHMFLFGGGWIRGGSGMFVIDSMKICKFEREMCPWAISKYFGDCVPTQGLKCVFMLLEEQSANQDKRYVSKS